MRCYKGETFVDTMVQTRGQQTGDQSPPGRGALWGITAEGDAVATTVPSGNTLKHAVSAPSDEHSATIPRGAYTGWERLVSPVGTGSLTQAGVSSPENGRERVVGVSVSRGVSSHPLGAVFQAGDGAGITESLRETEGCSGIEGAVCGVTSTTHNTLYSVPPCRHPVGQPIVFGDLGSGAVMRIWVRIAVCPTCLACLLQFMLGQCRLGHPAPLQWLQHAQEVLLLLGLTRVGQKLLFETNVWLTMRPDLGRKVRFHWFRNLVSELNLTIIWHT